MYRQKDRQTDRLLHPKGSDILLDLEYIKRGKHYNESSSKKYKDPFFFLVGR